jgi:hypothetical protein
MAENRYRGVDWKQDLGVLPHGARQHLEELGTLNVSATEERLVGTLARSEPATAGETERRKFEEVITAALPERSWFSKAWDWITGKET